MATPCDAAAAFSALQASPTVDKSPEAAYEALHADAESSPAGLRRFGAPFRRSAWLRAILAGQGLLPNVPAAWPANISFLQILRELNVGLPPVNGSSSESGFVVNIGAGDGKRLDIYHRPIDPTWPLFARGGFGGLAIEHNGRFSEHSEPTASAEPLGALAFASGKLSSTLAEVNQSGNIRIEWARATPGNIPGILRAHGTRDDFDALAIDTDNDEPALLSAILAAGFAPKTICININPDVPPPIQLRWRPRDRPTGESNASIAHSRLEAVASVAGLGAGSAETMFALLSPRYTLLAFELGRFSRWCMRCNQRMWFVRTELLPGGRARDASLTTASDMRVMFWSSVVASVEGPRLQAGKILAHSATWAMWRAKFDEAEATAIAQHAWQKGTNLARAFGGGGFGGGGFGGAREPPSSALAAATASQQRYDHSTLNGSHAAWCLHADPCPLHVITHAPSGSLDGGEPLAGTRDGAASMAASLPLGCELPSRGRGIALRAMGVPGGFAVPSLRPLLFARVSERLASSLSAAKALCAYAEDWARHALQQLCTEHPCQHHARQHHALPPVIELAVSTAHGDAVPCEPVSFADDAVTPGARAGAQQLR